jgi:dihydroorotate dehydrogenase subfamily 2
MFLNWGYQLFLKPIFFHFDPETIHDQMVKIGEKLGQYKAGKQIIHQLFWYQNPNLNQRILGIEFQNPIGLAAGFDKDALLVDIMPDVGFGFEEVGSITGEKCAGNDRPRLWRAPNSKSLVVYYGLKSSGCEIIANALRNKSFQIPIGTSIAKTNNVETVDTQAGVADYMKAFKAFKNIGDYYTINISCPNTFGGQPFTDPDKLELLLAEIDKIKTPKPIFVKLSPDLLTKQIDTLLKICSNHRVDGLVISNLTKNRHNPAIKDDNLPAYGGLSGKVVELKANKLIKYVYKKYQKRFVIIGCGGVFSAMDAYKKIRLGASLVQLITGMIYQGPQLIGEINRGLVKLLKKDGYSNISDAIGVDVD